MAKKGGKKTSSFAARSAAAKKGWETRRRGGAKATQATKPSKPKATPKTTTARGRARTAETRARAAVRSGGGTRAARSLMTAQRARDYYKATGTGKKRSGKTAASATASGRKPKAAAKPKAAKAKVAATQASTRAARPKAGTMAKVETTAAKSRRKPVGRIDAAKARRIIARQDANRPGLRKAEGSSRKTMNSIRTHDRASNFLLGSSLRAIKRGSRISVEDSVIKAVANASKGSARKVAGRQKAMVKPRANVSMAAMERRKQRVSDSAILDRRLRADSRLDSMQYQAGDFPKSKKKRADYFARAGQAELNRRQNALLTAQRARDFYSSVAHSASNFSLRPRYSTQTPARSRPLPASTSYFSAWRGYSYKPRRR